MENSLDNKKVHRESRKGRKFEKKKQKKEINNEVIDKQKNPKAFTFNSAIRAERRFRRKQDIDTKKMHIPLVDRTPIEPPPILIAVVGPPKVGKTTLINNLIKLFTKSPLVDIKGPVTIVTGKKRRITLIECNNDINSMIDLAKVADLVLLLCDASFGFEMEVFEFLNICQIHGMPRIMGILTHLDLIKTAKAVRHTKKILKHRFWTEVYPGAKLFYLSGIHHEEYLKNEIKNLGRFISVMKFRPLTWKTSHSYLLCDRYEDLTNQENIRKNLKCDRNIALYGYVRGVPLKKNSSVHIAGLGDIKIKEISYLPDPCPLPEQIKKRALIEKEKLIYAPFSGVGGIVYDKDAVYVELGGSHSHHKRNDDEEDNIFNNLIETKGTLDEKIEHSEMQIFSTSQKITPKDFEMYKNESDKNFNKELNALRKSFVEEKIESSDRIRRKVLFDINDDEFEEVIDKFNNNEENINSGNEELSEEENDEESGKNYENYTKVKKNKDENIHKKITNILNYLDEKKTNKIDIYKHVEEETSESDSEFKEKDEDDQIDSSDYSEEENDEIKWKNNLLGKAQSAFWERQINSQNLMKLVYGLFESGSYRKKEQFKQDNNEILKDDEGDDLLKIVSYNQQKMSLEKDVMNLPESSLMLPWNTPVQNWLNPNEKILIANCFVTGKWKDSEDANELLKLDNVENLSDNELYGDFEDLETGEKHTSTDTLNLKRKKNPEDEDKDENELADKQRLIEKKKKLKEKFDAEYDNGEENTTTYYDELKLSAEKQAELNKTVFENMPEDVRVKIEGYRPGMYIRIEFCDVPNEFIENFDPTYPIIVGSLNMIEENIGYINVKIKKHRWYSRILKSSDPLIISLGWRRFQTIPIFSKLEDDLKFRFLKYTPEHLTCNAHFWGPITPQGTGFLALQSVESNPEILKKQGFRIAATGTIQELDKSTQIMKKLKLIGHPMKIYKKTAFIKDMFNSNLEVAKFEGAKIKTVSGIRGQIKKALSKPEGCFRATFEDKILMSDIVFCRTWYKVDVPEYYNPVTTLLLSIDKKNSWKGVRTTGEIKRENGIKNSINKDNLYTPINREVRPFKPLVIPKKLQNELPYKDKPKYGVKFNNKRKSLERVAVIKEPKEQKVSKLMKMIKMAYEYKQEKMKLEMQQRLEKHRQVIAQEQAMKEMKIKQKKKAVFRLKNKNKGKK